VDQTFCTEHNEYGVDIQPITIKHKNNIPHQESELYNQLQYGQKKKDKRTNSDLQNITHKTKYRATRTP
jgi:hypothetical protein